MAQDLADNVSYDPAADDWRAPRSDLDAIFEGAREPKELVVLDSGNHRMLSRLGPDVVSAGIDAVLAQVSDRRFARRQLGALLLDQGFLAGIGNFGGLYDASLLQTAAAPVLAVPRGPAANKRGWPSVAPGRCCPAA